MTKVHYNRRKKLIELVEKLREKNISYACRRMNISRSQYYVYIKRFDEKGFDGLKNLSRARKSTPWETSDEIKEIIIQASLENPALGCDSLKKLLKKLDIGINASTIQKVLAGNNLELRSKRSAYLENLLINEKTDLTDKQIVFVESVNPWFKDREYENKYPGHTLIQDIIYLFKLRDKYIYYYHVVIDPYSLYTLGVLSPLRGPKISADLFQKAYDYFSKKNCICNKVISNSGKAFSYPKNNYYTKRLNKYEIDHQSFRYNNINTPGACLYYRKIFNQEFIPDMKKYRWYNSGDALSKNLNLWQKYFNRYRKIQGYKNFGKSPIEMILSNV